MKAPFCSPPSGRQDRLLKNYRLKKAFQCEKIPSFSDTYPPSPDSPPKTFPAISSGFLLGKSFKLRTA